MLSFCTGDTPISNAPHLSAVSANILAACGQLDPEAIGASVDVGPNVEVTRLV
jgi:hypothetical protein